MDVLSLIVLCGTFLTLSFNCCCQGVPLELSDVLNHRYSSINSFNGSWLTDDTILYEHGSHLHIYNITSQKVTPKLNGNVTLDGIFKFQSYSSDFKYALYIANIKKIYRHSYDAQYKIMNVESGSIQNLDNLNFLQLVEWSPVNHDLVFVKENNMFLLTENLKTNYRLTSDGKPGVIFNGIADWVYEEEVFSDTKALWFSKDGKYLAYAKFNDENVHEMNYFQYGVPGSKQDQYPTVKTFRYPKAGTTNPTVELYVTALQKFSTIQVKASNLNIDGETILTDVTWAPNNDIAATWMNRVQNQSNTFRCHLTFEIGSCRCKLILDLSEPNGWIDLVTPHFNVEDESFLQIIPLVQSDWRRYPQLVLVLNKNDWKPLTQGLLTVKRIIAWDRIKNMVFYEAVRASSIGESHIYMVEVTKGKSYCLTCRFPHQKCDSANIDLSKKFTYYTLSCRGPNIPYVHIYYTYALRSRPPHVIWESNHNFRSNIRLLDLPIIKDVDVVLKDGYVGMARMHLPRNIHQNSNYTIKYPLLVYVYGGPGNSIMSNQFSISWTEYLVSTREIIVVEIDGRGSPYKSTDQMFSVYRNLGRFEIEDQIYVTKYLSDRFSFIDKSRIGIWGWSYGGFSTAMALATDHENIFKCGISVAPVTDFLYYDSIYTERYMGLPTSLDNEQGYNWTDITRKVKNFVNKKYLLMHGNADDNVHYQQSMMLAKALETEDITFYQQSYPDQNHGIRDFTRHVYHTMNKFWTECFKLNKN